MKKYIKEPSIWFLIFLVGFPQISETIYTPSLPELAKQLQASGNQIQQTLSVYFFGFAIGVFCWGILCDKIGRRPSMLCGIAVYVAGSIGCLSASSVELLLFFRIIQAFGAATGSVTTQTIMRDCYDDNRRPQVFAKVSAVLAFSPAIGPLLGSVIAQYCGVSYIFLTLVLIGLIALLLSYFTLDETRSDLPLSAITVFSVAKRMLIDQHIWIFGSSIGIINGIIFSYYAEAPFIFINNLGFSVVEYGCLGFIVALASFLGAVIGKKLITKLHYIFVMRIGYIIMVLGILLFILPLLLGSSYLFSLTGICSSIFFIMIGIGISLPSCLSNALVYYRGSLGILGALLGLLYYVQVALITWGISKLHNDSMLILPSYLLVLACLLLILTLPLKRE